MNEAETRAEPIDPALKAAGWGVVNESRIRREYKITLGRLEGQGRRAKPLIADYVLEYRSHKLAVIEAKAWGQELTEGVAQAKNYADKIKVRFTYATNGRGIYAVDMHTGKERETLLYPTPDELWNLTFAKRDSWRDRFAVVTYEDKSGSHPGRYFQDIAVERVMEAIAAKRQRILLTLATGTGKTFIALQVAWKLFHSRWNLTREERAALAKVPIHANFGVRQQAFLYFVLGHYVSDGVEELDQEKLAPLLALKCQGSLSDAVKDLAMPAEDIGRSFRDFQKYLYPPAL